MTERMRLYRGIAVPAAAAAEVIERITRGGLDAGDGTRWCRGHWDLKLTLDQLRRLDSVSLAHTRSGEKLPRVFACGDVAGASYYACKHNRKKHNDTPILITFEADLADVIVDGRDFLYLLFDSGDPARAREPLRRLFGEGLLSYLDRAWNTADRGARKALCDVAVQDPEVIRAHAANTAVIGGKSNTLFASAFMVRLPVPASRIVDARLIDCSRVPSGADVVLTELG
jgi:hypothetical protein